MLSLVHEKFANRDLARGVHCLTPNESSTTWGCERAVDGACVRVCTGGEVRTEHREHGEHREHRKTQHADTSKAQLTLTSSPAEIRINMDDRMLKAMSSLILPWRASSPRARNVAIEPAKGPLGASIPSKTGTFALVLSPHASKHVWTAVFSSASSVACAHDGRVRAF